MKLKQHLLIADKMIEENNLLKTFNINKTAFKLGSIIPDLNCVYPAHRITTTEKRFLRRIKAIDIVDVTIVRSFFLGIVTHYICDYFCYAHSLETIGIKHKQYETNLYNYYLAHKHEIEMGSQNIVDIWNKNKIKSQEKCLKEFTMTQEDHCKLIFEQLKLMNDQYINEYKQNKSNWTINIKQMQRDAEYTLAVCNNIIIWILEPTKCVMSN